MARIICTLRGTEEEHIKLKEMAHKEKVSVNIFIRRLLNFPDCYSQPKEKQKELFDGT
jgi:hypothetical protein